MLFLAVSSALIVPPTCPHVHLVRSIRATQPMMAVKSCHDAGVCLTVAEEVTTAVVSGASNAGNEFRFGSGGPVSLWGGSVIGSQGGTGHGKGIGEKAQATNLRTPADKFRFGTGSAVIGFEGGTGHGKGVGAKAQASNLPTTADEFRFGSGGPVSLWGGSVIGFQGGTGHGKGIGESAQATNWRTSADEFRFGPGRSAIGFYSPFVGFTGNGQPSVEEIRTPPAARIVVSGVEASAEQVEEGELAEQELAEVQVREDDLREAEMFEELARSS